MTTKKAPKVRKKVKALPAKLSAKKAAAVKGGLVTYNTDGKPVARYHLQDAWPNK